MRQDWLADAERHGHMAAFTDLPGRSVRLELAMALSITEYAAGGSLITEADALVNRYPTGVGLPSPGRG